MISFEAYSSILAIFPMGIVSLILLQLVSDCASKRSDRVTTTLLYGVYVSSLTCACVGFSLHLFNNAIWCETFGMIPCFSMLGGCKAVLYLFFVRRAKLAQGITISHRLKVLLTYIAPSYLFIYWIAYCVLTTFLFSLKYTPHDTNGTVSNCLFGEWTVWFLAVAGCVDVFNCLSSLSLFLFPLSRAMQQANVISNMSPQTAQMDKTTQRIHSDYISLMKWNVALSSIASLSSVLTLVMITVSNHYIWLFCLGDPLINSTCTYFMIASNRQYVSKWFASDDEFGRTKGFSLHDWVKHNAKKQEHKETAQDNDAQPKAQSSCSGDNAENETVIVMQTTCTSSNDVENTEN